MDLTGTMATRAIRLTLIAISPIEDYIMRQLLSVLTAAFVAFGIAQVAHVATVGAAPKQAPAPAPTPAPEAVKQIKLTEQQVQNYIAAQADIAPIMQKIPAGRQPDQRTIAQLEAATKKHGFASFDEYDDVESNISLVLSGIDPETKKFTEPPEAIKAQIAQVTADRSIPAAQKRQILQELNNTLKSAAPVQFPSNVELITKYFDKLAALGDETAPAANPAPAPNAPAPKAKGKK